eukprot:Skav231973  [mRNA]  locus=scaffold1149:155165:166137:- [translate_table: standard]
MDSPANSQNVSCGTLCPTDAHRTCAEFTSHTDAGLPPLPLSSQSCRGASALGRQKLLHTQRAAVRGGGSGLVVATMPKATNPSEGGTGRQRYSGVPRL